MRTGISLLFKDQNAWSWPVKCDLALLLEEWSVCHDKGLSWALEHPHPLILQRSMKNIRWKIAIESGTSHVLSLGSPVTSFPLDSECRSKIKISYIHSWEAITSLMTTTALFLLVPSIVAHPSCSSSPWQEPEKSEQMGLSLCWQAWGFVPLGFYLIYQVNHVLKHLRCFSFCIIFLLFCQLSDCVFSSLTEEYLE